MLVKRLSMGQQQILEILKAISTNPKVLILDEPTSSLTESEIAYLFQNIRKLQEQGMSFIYITHKLSEIFQIASRVIVMRDGKLHRQPAGRRSDRERPGSHDGRAPDHQPVRRPRSRARPARNTSGWKT